MASVSIKKRLKRILRSPRLLLITGILVVLSTTLLFANKGLWRNVSLHHDIAVRNTELAKLNADEANVSHQISLLRAEDASTIERIARERYNMKRPGETIYRITN
jgi:cell division protein FtsB